MRGFRRRGRSRGAIGADARGTIGADPRGTIGARARGTIGAYARACHLGPTVAVTGFTLAIAVVAGSPWWTALLLTLAVLAGQLSIGWSNDYLDRALDRRAGRTDKALVRGAIEDSALRRAAVLALAACLPLSFAAGAGGSPWGWAAGSAHLAAVGWGWAYNLWLKRTAVSWLPYFGAFALLPLAVVARSLPGAPWPPASMLLAGGLLGTSAHFTNAVKDLDADALTGVRGLPQRLGPRWSGLASATLVAVAATLLLTGPAALADLAALDPSAPNPPAPPPPAPPPPPPDPSAPSPTAPSPATLDPLAGQISGAAAWTILGFGLAAGGCALGYAGLLLIGPPRLWARAFPLNVVAIALLLATLLTAASAAG